MPKSKTSMSLSPQIIAELDSRDQFNSRSGVMERDLKRLYTLYQYELKKIDLTAEEICLIIDMLNGHLTDPPETARLLWAQVEDEIRYENLAEKWKVDGDKLVEKLKSMSLLACLAIIDAAERFWAGPDRNRDFKEAVSEIFGVRQ